MKKKILATAFVATMALSIVACGDKKETKTTTEATTVETTTEVIATVDDATASDADATASDANAQLANPWEEYTDLNAAAKAAGLELTVPETINGVGQLHYQAIKGEMVEVFYGSINDDEIADTNIVALIRKANLDVATEDYKGITGDYTEYPEEKEVTVGDYEVTELGEDGKVSLVYWYTEKEAYSISFTQAVSTEEAAKVIEEVK